LTEIPGDVDLVVTALPTPKVTVAAVEECAQKGVKAVIIESAGFAEMGGEGKVYQQQIVDIAKKTISVSWGRTAPVLFPAIS
jgi:acyl-CoA synthetase (NDP forming)